MNRLKLITDAFESKGIDGVLVSEMKNVRYLSGFTGSSACLLISATRKILITDFRYQEQAGKETGSCEILIDKGERPKLIVDTAKSLGIRMLGFESTVTYAFYKELLGKGLRIKALTNFVEDLRKVKDRRELTLISEAISRAEKSFLEVRPFVRRGSTEKAIALMLEERLKKNGCGLFPFDIIVAAGANSSMPHARPTDNKIKAGDLVVIDWGGEAGGYFSDMTRTLLVKGRGMAKKKEIYEIVLSANRRAIASVVEGTPARDVDSAAREVIGKEGYDNFFGHGTGHGVGLDVHELPRISRLGRESVRAGMVFTIEPGIYIPGLGGVRIEDMVVAGKRGCRVLTALPKDLEVIR